MGRDLLVSQEFNKSGNDRSDPQKYMINFHFCKIVPSSKGYSFQVHNKDK